MKIMASLIVVVTAAACTPLFSQNIALAHKVKRGWTAQEVSTLMGQPALTLSIDGVDEWRYCSTRLNEHDHVAVLYFHGGQVIDRSFYSLDRGVRNFGTANPNEDTCLDSIGKVYADGRQPPRRVLDTRAAVRSSAR